MKFRIGDRVVISRDSEYYGRNQYMNPTDSVIGEVTAIGVDAVFKYQVHWHLGGSNSYRERDLVFADAIKPSHGYLLKFSFV